MRLSSALHMLGRLAAHEFCRQVWYSGYGFLVGTCLVCALVPQQASDVPQVTAQPRALAKVSNISSLVASPNTTRDVSTHSPTSNRTNSTVENVSQYETLDATGTTTTVLTITTTTTTARLADWLSFIGMKYFINLPETDNWSTYGALNTTWRKLRMANTPHLGDGVVTVDLQDWTHSASNGEASAGHNLEQLEWGIAADCGEKESPMRVNLVGTPFRYDAPVSSALGQDAHGEVSCLRGNQRCRASCGGWCGYCGFGEPSVTRFATLRVVDRSLYDEALRAFYGAAVEALHTTTATTATSSTSTTHSSTSTTTTTTATSTSLNKMGTSPGTVGVASASVSSGWTGTWPGLVVALFVASCIGIVIGSLGRHRVRRWFGGARSWQQFQDSRNGVDCSPEGTVIPQTLGLQPGD